jgi:hypothetical protein
MSYIRRRSHTAVFSEKRTSTRAISKSSEKVQAAILRKEEEDGRP